MSRVFSRLVLAAISFSLPVMAQESRATITGRVTDASAAAVIGARLRATNLQTEVAVTATSNESGAFLLPFLLPGKYRVTAEQAGFKTWSQNELELRVNDSVALDVRLEVGGQTETVEVTAGTPLLETADASLGNVIDERRLQELPQRGGNPLEL